MRRVNYSFSVRDMSVLVQELRELLMRATNLDEIATATTTWRNINPDAFHTLETLGSRVFWDQPIRKLPYLSFIKPARRLAREEW